MFVPFLLSHPFCSVYFFIFNISPSVTTVYLQPCESVFSYFFSFRRCLILSSLIWCNYPSLLMLFRPRPLGGDSRPAALGRKCPKVSLRRSEGVHRHLFSKPFITSVSGFIIIIKYLFKLRIIVKTRFQRALKRSTVCFGAPTTGWRCCPAGVRVKNQALLFFSDVKLHIQLILTTRVCAD